MVEQQSFRDGTNQCFIGQPMGHTLIAIMEQPAIAIAVQSSDPHPALANRGKYQYGNHPIKDLLDEPFSMGVGHDVLPVKNGCDVDDLRDDQAYSGNTVLIIGIHAADMR